MATDVSDLERFLPALGWCVPDGQAREGLEKQLRRELAPAHPLAGRSVAALARALGSDDAAFITDDGMIALVHLTYGLPDPGGRWPWTTMFPDVDALLRDLAREGEG